MARNALYCMLIFAMVFAVGCNTGSRDHSATATTPGSTTPGSTTPGSTTPGTPATGIDLIVTDVRILSTAPAEGAYIDWEADAMNNGTADAGGFVVAMWTDADQDGALDPANDLNFDFDVVQNLAAGATATTAGSGTTSLFCTPAALADGSFIIFAEADAGQAVTEADESNNLGATAAIAFAARTGGPDLCHPVPMNVTTPVISAGQDLTFDVIVFNCGDADAVAPFDIVFAAFDPNTGSVLTDASGNQVVTGGNFSQNLPADQAGGAQGVTLTIPTGTAAGTYILASFVDYSDTVDEDAGGDVAREENNDNFVLFGVQ